MAIVLDTSEALQTHDELVALVRAVHNARPEDETHSLEWKASYANLTSDSTSYAIARAILGMANRSVSVARATFQGFGYILIGVEPGALAGQQVPDSAVLLNAVRRYTGPGRPVWDPRTVSVDGKQVLVISVQSPRPGDRIAVLYKSYQPEKGSLVKEGTIFVRQAGATEPASRADLDMLQQRLLDGPEQRAQAARDAERHKEIRDLVADLIHCQNRWIDTMETMVIMSADNGWADRDMVEWFNTDSGRQMVSDAQIVSSNTGKLRLITNEPSLLEPLQIAENLSNTTALDGIFGRKPSDGDARTTAYRHLNSLRSAYRNVEAAATELLSKPVSDIST